MRIFLAWMMFLAGFVAGPLGPIFWMASAALVWNQFANRARIRTLQREADAEAALKTAGDFFRK